MCPTITNVSARSQLVPLLLFVCAGIVQAQEIKFIDLSNIRQRTELRSPPAPQSDCLVGQGCVGGGATEAEVLLMADLTLVIRVR